MFFWSFGQRNIGLSIQKKVANDQKWSKENNFQKGTEATPNTLKFILIFEKYFNYSVGSGLCGCGDNIKNNLLARIVKSFLIFNPLSLSTVDWWKERL